MPRRIENPRFRKLVVVVSFDGFSNAIFVGFFYSWPPRHPGNGHPGGSGGRFAAPANAESEPEVGFASHFGTAPGPLPGSGLSLAYNVHLGARSLCFVVFSLGRVSSQ